MISSKKKFNKKKRFWKIHHKPQNLIFIMFMNNPVLYLTKIAYLSVHGDVQNWIPADRTLSCHKWESYNHSGEFLSKNITNSNYSIWHPTDKKWHIHPNNHLKNTFFSFFWQTLHCVKFTILSYLKNSKKIVMLLWICFIIRKVLKDTKNSYSKLYFSSSY